MLYKIHMVSSKAPRCFAQTQMSNHDFPTFCMLVTSLPQMAPGELHSMDILLVITFLDIYFLVKLGLDSGLCTT
jgi:hypothetical protein